MKVKYLTGKRCASCDAPQTFEPGYLVTHSSGSMSFTCERVIVHDESCEAEEDADLIGSLNRKYLSMVGFDKVVDPDRSMRPQAYDPDDPVDGEL